MSHPMSWEREDEARRRANELAEEAQERAEIAAFGKMSPFEKFYTIAAKPMQLSYRRAATGVQQGRITKEDQNWPKSFLDPLYASAIEDLAVLLLSAESDAVRKELLKRATIIENFRPGFRDDLIWALSKGNHVANITAEVSDDIKKA